MKIIKQTTALVLLLCLLGAGEVWAFCGFYVAKAGAQLFNNKSQVIITRDGNRNVITMASDFNGDVKDFAMVIPVPVVLKREDIKVVNNSLFDKLDAYSAPRLVEYFDDNPCNPIVEYDREMSANEAMGVDDNKKALGFKDKKEYNVTIEAQYQVEEYDIIILSAQESGGLKSWLTDNGYSIPAKAEEVLEPYIKSNLKFFVVKVNLEKKPTLTDGYLRPLQIHFTHEKFMLPIRLGMANGNGEQDMIVYAFTKNGRVETANYRTVKIPSDRKIPLYVQARFDMFYRDMFAKVHKNEGRNAIFLEYAWDLSPYNYLKCDPCVGEVPNYSDMVTAGVGWLMDGKTINQSARVFFTRLHVRYGREMFPQDLVLMETGNTENFQGRYILTHPAKGNFDCKEGQNYLTDLHHRRVRENAEVASLTGWNMAKYAHYPEEYDDLIKNEKEKEILKQVDEPGDKNDTITPVLDGPGKGTNTRQWNLIFYTSLGILIVLSLYQLKQVIGPLTKR